MVAAVALVDGRILMLIPRWDWAMPVVDVLLILTGIATIMAARLA